MTLPSLSEVFAPFNSLAKDPLIAQAIDYVNNADHNPSADLPFHGSTHLERVAVTAAYFFHRDVMFQGSHETVHEVVLAALFHDFDHTGLSDIDSNNIERAIVGWETFHDSFKPNLVSRDVVSNLISLTSFPYSTPQTLSQRVLISADLYSNLLFALGDVEGKNVNEFTKAFVCGMDMEKVLTGNGIRSPLSNCLDQQTCFWATPTVNDERLLSSTALQWFNDGITSVARQRAEVWVDLNKHDVEHRIVELTWLLHEKQIHPDYQYTTVESARKGDSDPPEGLGWIYNPARHFERDDYTDTEYYMRTTEDARQCPTILRDMRPLQLPRYFQHEFIDYLRKYLKEHRILGGAKDDGFHSKAQYVNRAEEILSASRAPADIYMLSFGEFNGTDVKAGVPDIFEHHDSKDTPNRSKYGYLCIDFKPWKILVDLARPDEHTYVQHDRYGDRWFPWEYPLPINYYELKSLIETYL